MGPFISFAAIPLGLVASATSIRGGDLLEHPGSFSVGFFPKREDILAVDESLLLSRQTLGDAMEQPDRSILVVATITFAVLVLMPPSPAEDEALAMLFSGNSHFPWFLAIATLAGMPLAFAIPSQRAGFMGRAWKVPSTAYVIPRGVLRLLIGMIAGQALATLALGLWRDHRLLWLLPLHFLVGGAFCIGAWRRLRKPASAEFTMPWWPPLRGRFR